ncbi:hypothetical protein HN018_21955 (plasmid) [Lichenicola cladoniae]|uniref:Uncharacterized protein n=1 Tax=Lichenicola cladoniae TaxID=1484109 RepID=A0A6M8HWB9_9PROT|nr:hypothetical protein [Lichenicola cladoniae]NPD70092.1 hypothetical protein [Acetobacteraceae bacterium]QKE92894.1 hypothetical protein HN018_21955 [Lichenicola cladoniae]
MSDKALKVTSGAPQNLLLLSEVLERLRGKVGRTRLLAHIIKHPKFGGGRTHRQKSRKLLFTKADYARLLESFVLVPSDSLLAMVAAPSNQGAPR